jgi:hypothetical protein
VSLLEFLDVLVPGVLGPGCVGIFGDTESRNNLPPPYLAERSGNPDPSSILPSALFTGSARSPGRALRVLG